ncbi:MAG: hypothetical protein CM15mP40_06480 [Alphaproteobacteria bacterium]|nr:MAG: hypothetical protein CM15mP40_06480 [Alphaproteobacteria bacterium]
MPYVPDHRLSFGADYEYNDFDFGVNMTYHSESHGTADESETEVSMINGSVNQTQETEKLMMHSY